MDQLAGPAGRAGGEVTGLDQGHLQAARGGVERGAGAGDPAADDEHVELLVAQPAQVGGAPLPGRAGRRRTGRRRDRAPVHGSTGRSAGVVLCATWCIRRRPRRRPSPPRPAAGRSRSPAGRRTAGLPPGWQPPPGRPPGVERSSAAAVVGLWAVGVTVGTPGRGLAGRPGAAGHRARHARLGVAGRSAWSTRLLVGAAGGAAGDRPALGGRARGRPGLARRRGRAGRARPAARGAAGRTTRLPRRAGAAGRAGAVDAAPRWPPRSAPVGPWRRPPNGPSRHAPSRRRSTPAACAAARAARPDRRPARAAALAVGRRARRADRDRARACWPPRAVGWLAGEPARRAFWAPFRRRRRAALGCCSAGCVAGVALLLIGAGVGQPPAPHLAVLIVLPALGLRRRPRCAPSAVGPPPGPLVVAGGARAAGVRRPGGDHAAAARRATCRSGR